jgi:outer membrane protein assembly factor BamB
LKNKSLVFQKELGRVGEKAPGLPDSFFSSVNPDAYDLNRFVPSPVVVGNKVIAVTPSGKVQLYDGNTGNLLWEDTNFSLIYATPAYSNGKLVVVDKYGKVGCYSSNQTEAPRVAVIYPDKQIVIGDNTTNYDVEVKWIVSGIDNLQGNYYVHFYYDTDRTGYN